MTESEDDRDDLVTTKVAPGSVNDTVIKLQGLLADRDMKVFAIIDQSDEARQAGLELRDTTLVFFGNPRAGTPVMTEVPLAALDLPLKVLVWSDEGTTKVSYTNPKCLAERYDLSADLARALAGIDPLTDALVSDS
jgi:uncharacterized protein (DUF302 family)